MRERLQALNNPLAAVTAVTKNKWLGAVQVRGGRAQKNRRSSNYARFPHIIPATSSSHEDVARRCCPRSKLRRDDHQCVASPS